MITDTILQIIEEKGLSRAEAAKAAGMSRQNFWDKIDKRNPRFNSVEQIMFSLGMVPHIKTDGQIILDYWTEKDVLDALRKENLCFDATQNIFSQLGYQIIFTDDTPTKK